jgi:hypothetical protein
MPAELRNTMYEFCMTDEEKKVLNVLHYPHGIPRRSNRGVSTITNFAHFYLGFTQTRRQVRNEFTPWLQKRRNVRKPLATLNDYTHTFHGLDSITGERVGRVEPICTGAPLRGDGVEILELLNLQFEGSPFYLQLVPTSVSQVLDWLQPEARVGDCDELNIFRGIGRLYEKDIGSHIFKAGLSPINITSVPLGDDKLDDGREYFDHEDMHTELSDDEDDDDLPHRILIKLKVGTALANQVGRDKQISQISRFVYDPKLTSNGGVEVSRFLCRWRRILESAKLQSC